MQEGIKKALEETENEPNKKDKVSIENMQNSDNISITENAISRYCWKGLKVLSSGLN